MTAADLTDELRALLAALDPTAWRSVGYRPGPFRPYQAEELVNLGLAERRPRAWKPGAHEYRLTQAGVAALRSTAAKSPKPPIPGAPYLGYGSFDALVDARPDRFDDFDCRPPSEGNLSDEYSDSLIPEHMRELVMARRRARRAAMDAKAR
jgi:hypothetical protein